MGSAPTVWLTPFNRVELAHAFYLQVFRIRITAAQARRAWTDFEDDCARGILAPVSLPNGIWTTCIDLVRSYAPTLGVRTLDSLHVACALELKAQKFWTFDERQARLAEAVGLDSSA